MINKTNKNDFARTDYPIFNSILLQWESKNEQSIAKNRIIKLDRFSLLDFTDFYAKAKAVTATRAYYNILSFIK